MNYFCITFDFFNLFLRTNFYEFRKELTILYPTNSKDCEKNVPLALRTHALLFNQKRCFCTYGVFNDF